MSVSRHVGCEGERLRQLPFSNHRAANVQVVRRRRLHVQARFPRRVHLRRFEPVFALQGKRKKVNKIELLHTYTEVLFFNFNFYCYD